LLRNRKHHDARPLASSSNPRIPRPPALEGLDADVVRLSATIVDQRGYHLAVMALPSMYFPMPLRRVVAAQPTTAKHTSAVEDMSIRLTVGTRFSVDH
jgi:hypothetical protein